MFQTVDDLDQVSKTASEPGELPDDERIAFAGKIDGRFQTDSLVFRTGSDVFVNFRAAELFELVCLQR